MLETVLVFILLALWYLSDKLKEILSELKKLRSTVEYYGEER